MKHADSLTPTETLYESRLDEALLREEPHRAHHIKRQVRVRCKGCHSERHKRGKLWIIDFYIHRRLAVETDGHPIDRDRDLCLNHRGLTVLHIPNQRLYEMAQAVHQAVWVWGWTKLINMRTNAIRRGADADLIYAISETAHWLGRFEGRRSHS